MVPTYISTYLERLLPTIRRNTNQSRVSSGHTSILLPPGTSTTDPFSKIIVDRRQKLLLTTPTILYTPITIALQTALTYSHHKGRTYVVLYQPIPTKFPRPFGRWLHFASADEGSSRRFLIGGITRRCPTRQFICIDNHPSIPKEVVQR